MSRTESNYIVTSAQHASETWTAYLVLDGVEGGPHPGVTYQNLGGGVYLWTASVDDDFFGKIRFKNAGATIVVDAAITLGDGSAAAAPAPAASSISTLAEVEAAYDDNASYAETNSAAKARAFVTAARILLRRIPEISGTREANVQFRMDLIQKELAEARAWLRANDVAGGNSNALTGRVVTRASFRDFRR